MFHLTKLVAAFRGMRSTVFVQGALLITICLSASFAVPTTVQLSNGGLFFGGTYNGCEDTYLREAYPGVTPGAYSEINVGFETYNGGGRARGLIRFDLTPVKAGMGPTSQITAARLLLRMMLPTGPAFTGKTVNLYRVSTANKTWVAGNSATRLDSVISAASWNYRLYTPLYFEDAGACPRCHRDEPWKGDATVWSPNTGIFTAGKGNGCGTAGVDYNATPVATATVSSTDANTWVTFTITDRSFLTSWINNQTDNEGFLIRSTDLEVGSVAGNTGSVLKFFSAENSVQIYRPVLELDIDPLNATSTGISYTFPTAGKVSIVIAAPDGRIVKELLAAAPRNAGAITEFWDCKDDPIPIKCDIPAVVPDGIYTVKVLQTQGLSAEYLLDIGTSGGLQENQQMPGNHVSPGGLAVDASGVYIAAPLNESTCALRKQTPDGALIFSVHEWTGWNGPITMVTMGDTIHSLTTGGTYVASSASTNREYKRILIETTGLTGDWTWDIAARKGHVLVGNLGVQNNGSGSGSSSICWITPATGAKIGSPIPVSNLGGVVVDLNGDALVISGTTVKRYAFGATTGTTIISSNLVLPEKLDVNPTNGDIYVMDHGSSQQIKVFSSTGTFLRPLGKLGGRRIVGGSWNPATDGFRHKTIQVSCDIAVAPDGSFYIAEVEPARRVAHYGSDGTFIKEWFCGTIYNPHASPEPTDPRKVWVDYDYNDLMRCQIDYAAKTWSVAGIYQKNQNNSFTSGGGFAGMRWNPVNRGGNTYLVFDGCPLVSVLDKQGDSLRYVASGGFDVGNDTNLGVMTKYWVGNFGGWKTWADANGNSTVESSEIIASQFMYLNNRNGFDRLGNFCDSNFTVYGHIYLDHPDWANTDSTLMRQPIPGPAVYRPELLTVNGYTIPKYDLKKVGWPFLSSIKSIAPADTNWDSFCGSTIDGKGNIYTGYLTHRGNATDPSTYWTGNPQSSWGGARIVKCNVNTGKAEWVIGKYAPNEYAVPTGAMGNIQRMLGAFRGCFGVADFRPNQYVYTEDGQYVGKVLDNKLPFNGVALPADQIITCGEQTAGRMVEVTRDDIPGLTKGDVLFFSGAINSAKVFRVKGFDNFIKKTFTITVAAGKITTRGPDLITLGQAASSRPVTARLNVSNSNGLSIGYAIPRTAHVSIELFTALGQKVSTLVDREMEAGNHSIAVNAQDLKGQTVKSGFYIVRLKTDGVVLTKQLAMVK